MSAIALIPFRDGMSGINLVSRTGGTPFSIEDLRLFFFYENPPQVERTAYIGVPVLIFSLIGIFSAFRAHDAKFRKFIFINAVLVIITILIAFGLLLTVDQGNFVFNSILEQVNSSYALALAVLSAIGLDFVAAKLQGLSARYSGLTTSMRPGSCCGAHFDYCGAILPQKLFNNFARLSLQPGSTVDAEHQIRKRTPSASAVRACRCLFLLVCRNSRGLWHSGVVCAQLSYG
jgi:hypothetical protein